jgi:transposase-like protein
MDIITKLKLRIGKDNDKRIKLSDEDKEEIKKLYQEGWAIRAIARKFNVDKQAIKFCLFDWYRKRQYANKRKRNWDYNREKHTIYMRIYRQRLRELYKEKLKNK